VNAGDVIYSRYELVELLGRGGMAEVWRALDSHLGRQVAIKFLAPQLSSDPEFLVRFFSEAQAVARISHPNVVQVLDFGEEAGSPFLVMEEVANGPLTEVTGAPVQPDRALEIIAGAAAGAGAAHELGIVHRDIKPGNILLDEDRAPKLADFGIASSGRSERLTATGAAIGSPHYISPEQASGGEATPASDVYSLGVVLFELLTGRRPFEGDNVTAVAIAQVEEEPPVPSSLVPEITPAIDALLMRCLAKDPESRYRNGSEMAAALSAFDPEEEVVAAAPATYERPWWATRRALAGAAVAALLMAVPVYGVLSGGDEPVSAGEDEPERLPNVGGLKMSATPSPSVDDDVDDDPVATPTPTKSHDEENEERETASRDQNDEDQEDTGGGGEDPPPDPEPTPEPTEPEPEPTDARSPAP
jgi:eukaryotic-like serine/threonine-protein kinase